MTRWRDALRALAESLGSGVRRGTNALERLVDRDPYHVVGYRGSAAGAAFSCSAESCKTKRWPSRELIAR